MATDPTAGDEEDGNGSGERGGGTFDSDGTTIAYDDVGEGPPIVLVHGFASSRDGNWRRPGWYDALAGAGRRVIALDCRGHGGSEKPLDERLLSAVREGLVDVDETRVGPGG